MALVDDFAKNYDALTDEKAKELLKRQFQIDDDRLKLRRSYAGKFEKVLPAKKVARYYQIENKLDAAVAYEAAQGDSPGTIGLRGSAFVCRCRTQAACHQPGTFRPDRGLLLCVYQGAYYPTLALILCSEAP